MSFCHLHLHSEFSIQDSTIRLPELMAKTQAHGSSAVALTDLNNIFGMVKFYQQALNAHLKPIIGAEVLLENTADRNRPFKLVLLCQNNTGYFNLSQLLTLAHTQGQTHGHPTIQKPWLFQHATGLLCLALAQKSDFGQALLAENSTALESLWAEYTSIFEDRFYLSIQRIGQPEEAKFIEKAFEFASTHSLPLVATNAVCFLEPKSFMAHETRVCIQQGEILENERRPRYYTQAQYLKTPEQMQKLFSDLPEALENVSQIILRCNVSFEFGKVFLPKFHVCEKESEQGVLAEKAQAGLKTRFNYLMKHWPKARDFTVYQDRLKEELSMICKMGFAGYFLIVADFIAWAKAQNIPVGPGRGSGAGSLVAYCLGITGLDPLEYDLLFERFLNPERVSMPDFDIDFCMHGRDRVIDYVQQKYGRKAVSQIITYGTMAAKAVVRDVGRVLGQPYGFVDKIAKLIPFEIGMTLEKALEDEVVLKTRYKKEEEVKSLIDLAKQLEGLTRNVGKHAGGVVIAPSELTDFCPLYCEANLENLVTQFDKNDVESLGLVKFDFLGLRTLTIIDSAVKNIQSNHPNKQKINIETIDLTCIKTFKLLQNCQTTAVFQLESRGMKELIHRLQPDCFEDIIALVALFRPGPLQSGMVDDFIHRKHGLAEVSYLYPSLEKILKPTYGIILYQEQVIQIAQVLSGYTLGGADLLRRAMGKKKPAEMAKQRNIFISGAVNKGVPKHTATQIFDLIEKFAGYGFNKSHSAAYALLAYQTAWLKTHYLSDFMAAVLSADLNHTDKILVFIEDCLDLKLTIHPPCINRSILHFKSLSENEILYGLGAIKGVGEGAVAEILAIREQDGPFESLLDFCKRIASTKVTRRTCEALILAGAFSSLEKNTRLYFETLEANLKASEQFQLNQARGQQDLFESQFLQTNLTDTLTQKALSPWPEQIRLAHEKGALGFYLTGHPIHAYANELKRFTTCRIGQLNPEAYRNVRIAGFVVGVRALQTKRGEKMAFLGLEDKTGRQEIAVFSDLYASKRALLIKENLLVVEGQLSKDEYTQGAKMRANAIMDLETARSELAESLRIVLKPDHMTQNLITTLKTAFQETFAGDLPVFIDLELDSGLKTTLRLGPHFQVKASNSLVSFIANIVGADQVMLDYTL